MSTTDEIGGPRSRADGRKMKDYDIAVNGEIESVSDERVTFEQLVRIAYPGQADPNIVYTITYRGAKGRDREGELAPGESVIVKKKGTSFDVYPTGKS